MRFDVIGEPSAPKRGLMLHGMALDAREFREIAAALSNDYCLILPTFDGHHAEGYIPFTTLTEQVGKILAYLADSNLNDFDFVAGTSLGALAAFEIYKRGTLRVRKYVLDGGPFFVMGRKSLFVWKLAACALLTLAKLPFAAPLGNGLFPAKFIRAAAQTSLTMKDIQAMSASIFNLNIPEPLSAGHSRLIFCYGGKEDAFRSYRRLEGLGGHELIVKDGYGHCGFAASDPRAYADMLRG
jgi:pimeloyl-ACP methyl ester carboxylesterase